MNGGLASVIRDSDFSLDTVSSSYMFTNLASFFNMGQLYESKVEINKKKHKLEDRVAQLLNGNELERNGRFGGRIHRLGFN